MAEEFIPKKFPLVLENVVGPGQNRFWRKTAVETDADYVFDSNVSFAHADLFDGNSEEAIISGGAQNSFYLSDFPIANKPPYGDASIVGANLFFRVTSGGIDTTGSARGLSPRYKFYMVEEHIGKDNEGTITPYPTGQYPDSPIAAFCSYFDESASWMIEDFSNGGQSHVINGNVVKSSSAYLPLSWAKDNDQIKGIGDYNWDKYSDVLSNGTEVIYVEQVGSDFFTWDPQWVPTKGREWYRTDPAWHVKVVKKQGLPYYNYETQSEITINPPATTENTFFDSMWQYDSTTVYDEDGVSLALGSQITFDSKNSKEGGSALRLEANWHTKYSGSLGWTPRVKDDLETATATKKGENNDRVISIRYKNGDLPASTRYIDTSTKTWIPHRISAVAVKKLPRPILSHGGSSGMDWTGTENGTIFLDDAETGYTGRDKPITSSEVAIDINVDAMSPAPFFAEGEKSWYNDGDKSGFEFSAMDPRSFCIMFGTRAPRTTETYFDYFCNTRGSQSIWNGKGTAAVGDGAPGASGDRDGMSTGVIINRPSYTSYIDSDGDKIQARGKSGPGSDTKMNGAPQYVGSDIGYPFGEDGLMLLPLISKKAGDWANYVNGAASSYGEGGYQNPWSVFGIQKSLSQTGYNESDYYGTNYGKGNPTPTKDGQPTTGSQYAVFIGHNAKKTNLEQYDVPLPMGSWITLRFFLNGHDNDSIYIQIEEAGTGKILGRTYCNYPSTKTVWGLNAPLYMSLWCNGFPMTYNDNDEGNTSFAWGESKHKDDIVDTSTVVYIDKIELKNFNMVHNNATITDNNIGRESLSIKANPVTNKNLIKTVSPSYLSFGFENASDIDGNPTHLLFNNFSGSASLPDALGETYIRGTAGMEGYTSGIVEEYLGLSKFVEINYDSSGNEVNTSYQSPFNNKSVGDLGITTRGLVINSGGGDKMGWWDGSATTLESSTASAVGKGLIEMDGNTTDVENFSSKGLMKIDYSGGTPVTISTLNGACVMDYGIGARENQWVSARIIEYDRVDRTVEVDDSKIFNLKDGLHYRVYLRDETLFGTAGENMTYQDFYLDEDSSQGSTIKLKGTMNNYLFTEKNLSNLWIGPKLHWIILETLPYDSSDDSVEDRSYGAVVEVNRGNTTFPATTDFGVTFNETTYNDGIRQNARSLDFANDNSAVKLDTDFGFGEFDTEELTGGELSRVNISTANTWYSANMDPAISVGGLKEGDILTTLFVPLHESATTKTTIHTTESTTKNGTSGEQHYKGVFRPFLLTTFEDKLPLVENFSVSPDEERPFNPKFTWSCKDTDIWYGFLIVDDEYIHHQYHKSVLHMPLNRPKSSVMSPVNDALWYSQTIKDKGNLTMYLADREIARDPEGLSGWCHRFTNPSGGEGVSVGWDTVLTKTDLTTANNTMLPTTEMSLVMHIIPDYQDMPTALTQTLYDNGGGATPGGTFSFFKLSIDEDGYATVNICPDNCIEDNNGNTARGSNSNVILTSKTIIPMDGVTPTNIIVTLDAGLKRNNVKLFINGKLEDTTGRAYVSGETSLATSDRWPFNTSLATPATKTFMALLGNVVSASDFDLPSGGSSEGPYKGRMEEVVYYPICIYPVDVMSGEYTLEKPLRELSADNKSKSYSAKLFVKDYHNIRGTTISEVASTTNVSWRKSVPLFTEASD